MPAWLANWMDQPLADMLLRVGLVLVLAAVADQALRLVLRQVRRRLETTTEDSERLERLVTLVAAGRGLGRILILVVAGLMILHTVGLNITPLLASAGVAGLALSLGAQTLIKDFIGGVLVLVENQYAIGDVIQVGEASGTVERITLRATYLRDVEGRLQLVPNGDVRLVSNLTAGWSRAVINLNVDYGADFGRVLRALEGAASRAAADERIQGDLLEVPQAVGWVGFSDWAVQVRLMAKTAPGKQWAVMTALRQYAVEALQAEGVRVALPGREVRLEQLPPEG